MRFEITDSLIIYRDERPGEHATLFHNDKKLSFRDDASNFNDSARRYAWAFDRPALKSEDVLIFATGDREVVGVVAPDGHASILVSPKWRVVRLGTKPFVVEPQ